MAAADKFGRLKSLIGSDGYLWVADDLSGGIGNWTDQIQSEVATYTAGATAATVVEDTGNGLYYVNWAAATTSYFQTGAITQLPADYVVGGLVKWEHTTDFNALIDGDDSSNRCALYHNNTGSDIKLFAGTVVTGWSPALSSLSTASARYNGASSYGRENAVQGSTVNPGTQRPNGLTIGADYSGAAVMEGRIYLAYALRTVTNHEAIDIEMMRLGKVA